jgi:azurin
LVLTAALLGCGGGGEAETEKQGGAASDPEKVTGPVDKTIRLTGNDELKFNRTKFTVKAGQTVKVVMRNIGSQPISSAGHNFTLLKEGVKPETFGPKCTKQGGKVENDYLPESLRDRVLATTELLGPGEEDRVVFEAPQKPGERAYLCTFTGHFPTMKGTMVIEPKDGA